MEGHAQSIRDETEAKRDGDLEEETNGSEGVGGESGEAKAVDDGGRVRVERALRTIVAEGDEEVDPAERKKKRQLGRERGRKRILRTKGASCQTEGGTGQLCEGGTTKAKNSQPA